MPVPGTAREAPLYSGDRRSQWPNLRNMPSERVGGTDLAQKGEALFPLYGPGMSSEGQGGGWDRDLKVECLLPLVLQLQFLLVLQNPDKS